MRTSKSNKLSQWVIALVMAALTFAPMAVIRATPSASAEEYTRRNILDHAINLGGVREVRRIQYQNGNLDLTAMSDSNENNPRKNANKKQK